MALYTKKDETFYKTFATTFKGSIFTLFINLSPHSVTFLYDLSKIFVAQFSIGVPTKQTSTHLFSTIQNLNESLQSFITQFNSEAF